MKKEFILTLALCTISASAMDQPSQMQQPPQQKEAPSESSRRSLTCLPDSFSMSSPTPGEGETENTSSFCLPWRIRIPLYTLLCSPYNEQSKTQ